MIRAGLLIVVVAWLPLLAVWLLNLHANPVGLGLFAWGTSVFGLALAAVGLIRWLIRNLRRS